MANVYIQISKLIPERVPITITCHTHFRQRFQKLIRQCTLPRTGKLAKKNRTGLELIIHVQRKSEAG